MNEKDELTKREANLFVATPQYNQVFAAFEDSLMLAKYANSGVVPVGKFVVGESRIGKTRALSICCNQASNILSIESDESSKLRPALLVHAPVPFTLKGLYYEIIHALGSTFSTRTALERAYIRVVDLLTSYEVKVLIIDEIEHLINSKYAMAQDAMEMLIDLSNVSNVSLICCGLPHALHLLDFDPKYHQKFSVLRLHPFMECNDEFISMLEAIEKEIDAPFSLGFSDKNAMTQQFLFEVCKGNIGKLRQFIHELFVEIGLYDNDVALSEMKVTFEAMHRAYKKMSSLD